MSGTTAIRKRRRGRPQVIPAGMEEEVVRAAPHVRTPRGRQNVYYRTLAQEALADDPKCAWLATGPAGATILAELGRFQDPAAMRAAAREVCRSRPKAADAVAMLRRQRLGREARGDAKALAALLDRTLRDYLRAHPGVTWEEARNAVVGVLEEISEKVPLAEGSRWTTEEVHETLENTLYELGWTGEVVGPVDREDLPEDGGVYLLANRSAGWRWWVPVRAGQSGTIRLRTRKTCPEGQCRAQGGAFFAISAPRLQRRSRMRLESAVKAAFGLR